MDNPDLWDVAPLRVRGERVGGIPEARCYRFRAGVAAGRLAALSEAGRVLLGDAEVVVEDVAAIPLPEEDVAGVANDAGGRTWRALENRGGVELGDEVRPAAGDVVRGDRALVMLAGEVVAACATHLGALEFKNEHVEAVGADARTLPARFNVRGDLYREFPDGVAQLTEEVARPGWPVDGPRTVLGLLEAYARLGRTPRGHHSQWVQQAGIPREDRSRYEHEVWCHMFEVALCFDQLNVASLGCMEVAARRVQLIEDAHRLSATAPSYEGAAYFLGDRTGGSGAVIVPSLSAHVATRMHADAQVTKERRKQKEELGLGQGSAPPNK